MLQYCTEALSYTCRFSEQLGKHQKRTRKHRGSCKIILKGIRGKKIGTCLDLNIYQTLCPA